jgi:DNA-directed RNA polymerase specialized sigma24 family protein
LVLISVPPGEQPKQAAAYYERQKRARAAQRRAYRVGVDQFYESIVRDHYAQVEALCEHVLGDAEDAHDATEEAFLRVQEALPRYDGQEPLEEWITRIAASVCADQLRVRGEAETD